MTIIYSNAEDIDCHVLRYAFENLKDVNLVEIDKSSVNWIDKFTRQGLYYYDRD